MHLQSYMRSDWHAIKEETEKWKVTPRLEVREKIPSQQMSDDVNKLPEIALTPSKLIFSVIENMFFILAMAGSLST